MTLETFFDLNPDFLPVADMIAMPPTTEEVLAQWPDADRELLERCDEPVNHSGLSISRGTLYWKCRLTGSGNGFAAMLALGQPPGIETTDTFWAGRKSWREVYGEDSGYVKDVERRLKAQGIEIGDKEYMPELARFRGDKEAVFSRDNIRGAMKGLCQRRGWAIHGAVNVEHREPESDPHAPENCKPLADHIIKQSVCDMVKENPDLRPKAMTRKGRRALVQEVIQKHGRTK